MKASCRFLSEMLEIYSLSPRVEGTGDSIYLGELKHECI